MSQGSNKTSYRGIRAIVIVSVLLLGAYFVFYRSDLDLREIHGQIASWGPWGPIAWTVCLWLLLPFMAPVSVLMALAGLAFGPWQGFLSAYVGVVGGGWLVFWISRFAGRQFVEKLLGAHADRLDPHLETHGFFGSMYLRMLPIPFVPVSYLAGLTRISFGPYAAGTAVGIIPGVLVNTVVAGTVGEVWLTNQGWEALVQPRTMWAAGVVAASLIAPFAIEGVRRWRGSAAAAATITKTIQPDDSADL